MSQKFALIIGNSEYEDPNLTKLVTPDADVNALAEVLGDPEMSSFDEVMPLINQPVFEVRRTIARFFAKKTREDLLLFYFSGHGMLDDEGHLYLAVKDTERDLLRATAIPATFITSEMDRSRSQRQVLILDCCHSGAFERGGSKGVLGASVGTKSVFEGTGYGRVVLTASDATQYAWEGDQVIGEAENSVFTHYMIQGIRTGAADADADGKITVDELYDYVYEQVISQTPKQKPGKWSYKQQGEIVIARNPHLVITPAELPPELQQAIESPFTRIREGAVHELDNLLRGSDKGLALAAQEVLERMVDDDSRRVSKAATESLATCTEKQSPSTEPGSELELPEPKTEIGQEQILETKSEKTPREQPERPEKVSSKQQEISDQAKTKQPSEGTLKTPTIRLRSEPLVVSEKEAQKTFRVEKAGLWAWFSGFKPLEYIENIFEDQGEVVVDHTTGLMWQRSGSGDRIAYKKVQAYIDQLNRKRFGGYENWRLPTIPELISLLEPEETQSNGLYINSMFDTAQRWCWAVDKRSSGSAWLVDFGRGRVRWDALNVGSYVRAVRS